MWMKALALVSTVLLLVGLAISVLSTLPLLILRHHLPMDSRVVRQVFHYAYRWVALAATASAIGHGLEQRWLLAACTASIALAALVLHQQLLQRMDASRVTLHDGDAQALRRFRQLHLTGVMLNALLLALAVWIVSQIPR